MSVSEREIDQYLETALWVGTDDDQEPLDSNYTVDDFTQAARNQARVELNEFEEAMDRVVAALGDDADDLDFSSWPYDFWLTRNGHGVGFWDREEKYGDAAEALTALAHRAGERYVLVDWGGNEDEEPVPVLSFDPPYRTGG